MKFQRSPALAGYTEHSVRVRYGDVDQLGFVYYANYLRWFEIGRAEYLRARGKSYRDMEADGIFMPVVEAHICYRAPSGYDDLLTLQSSVGAMSYVRLTFEYALYRLSDEVLIAEGYTTHACLDRANRLQKIPQTLKEIVLTVT